MSLKDRTETIDAILDTQAGDAATVAAVTAANAQPYRVEVAGAGEAPDHAFLYGYDPKRGHRLIDSLDLEAHRPQPSQKRGDVGVATPQALVTYARRHLDERASTLWGDIDAGQITVVFNDHADQIGPTDPAAGWADHRAALQLQRPPEWNAWTGIDSRWLSQVDLAEFLEEHLLEVVQPDGSTLLEVTQTFHATTGARFKSSQQLHSGEQRLVYEEDVQARAGRTSHVEVPTDLTVRLRPWLGVDPVDIPAKFRFRVRDGGLWLGVKLLYIDDVSRTAVEDALATVSHELGLPAIQGTAPSARR